MVLYTRLLRVPPIYTRLSTSLGIRPEHPRALTASEIPISRRRRAGRASVVSRPSSGQGAAQTLSPSTGYRLTTAGTWLQFSVRVANTHRWEAAGAPQSRGGRSKVTAEQRQSRSNRVQSGCKRSATRAPRRISLGKGVTVFSPAMLTCALGHACFAMVRWTFSRKPRARFVLLVSPHLRIYLAFCSNIYI